MSDLELKNYINNDKNYNDSVDIEKENVYINKYIDIIHQYLLYCGENVFIQDPKYYLYVIVKGIECISNVFNILFLYTKNFNLVYYHCQKAFCYYVEFIGQIGNENHSYLKLTAKDAILFVYRKTIFQISTDFKKSYKTLDKEKNFFNNICCICKEINKIIEFQLKNLEFDDNNKKMKEIIVNNSEILKHIYYKENILDILELNTKIVNELFEYFDIKTIISVIIYYNKKLSNIDDIHKEQTMIKKFNFLYNDSYLNYTPLRLSNVLLGV